MKVPSDLYEKPGTFIIVKSSEKVAKNLLKVTEKESEKVAKNSQSKSDRELLLLKSSETI